MESRKCNKTANEHRTSGNEFYKQSKFYEALVCYNKSICFALPGSVELSLGFANRSAVYMEVKQIEMCLENIQLAIDCGYPKEKMKTLIMRQEKCLDMMETLEMDPDDDPWNFFKLSHTSNNKIPWIIDGIELRESKKFGRYLITTKALKAGDIIAIEEPFFKFLYQRQRYSRCVNCLKSLLFNLFPCLECTYTMFCSNKCMEMGQRFHKMTECQVYDLDTNLEADIFETGHRYVSIALGIFERIRNLEKFIDEHPMPKTVFDFDFNKLDQHETEKNLLLAIYSLHGNPMPEKLMPIMERHVDLVKSITTNPKNKKFLEKFMRRLIKITITNSFGMNMKTADAKRDIEIGCGTFPFASFFNHSCAPNIFRVAVDNKLVFIVARPIAKNQQLFVCYRNHFMIEPRHKRQEELLKSYQFKCSCEACIKNYAIINDLPSIFSHEFIEPESRVESVADAKREYKNNCEYIERNIGNYPSYEICMLISRNCYLLDFLTRLANFFP